MDGKGKLDQIKGNLITLEPINKMESFSKQTAASSIPVDLRRKCNFLLNSWMLSCERSAGLRFQSGTMRTP